MKRSIIATAFYFLAFALASADAIAQRDTTKLRQEVEVTKAYQPTISEAEKINDIPKVKAEPTEPPTFEYSIYSKPVFSTFDPTPVAAAKMVGEPKSEMETGLLKLGLGNYMTPYGELFFNAQPDKNSNFGMHFRHLSSYGKIKLLNGDKVKAPQNENYATIFGEKFYRRSTLSGGLTFDHKAFNYYGYTGDLLSDVDKAAIIPRFREKQHFIKGGGYVRLKTGLIPATDLNYDFAVNYHHFRSKTGQAENQAVISADLHKKFGKIIGALDASVTYYTADSIRSNFSGRFDSKQQILINANPSVMWKTKVAKLQLGLNTTMVFDDDADASLLLWPKVKAEWSPVPQVLTLFAGADGHLQHNTYSVIAAENPFVDPYHDVKNANYKYIISGGLKGKLSQKTNFVTQASYSKITDQHFYYSGSLYFNKPISPLTQLNNTFDWLYDDLSVVKLSGEVLHSVSADFSLHLSGNYYSYKMNEQLQPWNLPNFDISISGTYKPTPKLKFTSDIFVIGKRTALLVDYNSPVNYLSSSVSTIIETSVTMDPIIDLNVGGEYQFSEKLNFFARLNNFGFQKYEQWLGYTNKSFNWLAGISYSF